MYFNCLDSWEDLGVIVKINSVPQANKRYENVVVPGRNGSLYFDEDAYDEDAKVELTLYKLDVNQDFRKINEWLNNIKDNRLSLYKNGLCYHVNKVIHNPIEYESKTIHKTKVTFICDPYLYDINNADVEVSENFDIFCNGNEGSDTLFKVYGNGNIMITVNGQDMIIKDVSEYVEVDSNLMQVRNKDGTSKDWDTLGDFQTLNYGINNISLSGNIEKCILTFCNRYRLGDEQHE